MEIIVHRDNLEVAIHALREKVIRDGSLKIVGQKMRGLYDAKPSTKKRIKHRRALQRLERKEARRGIQRRS